jgi:hypothetical protein
MIASSYGCSYPCFCLSTFFYLGYCGGLLIRFSPSFNYWLNVILLLVSGLTLFMAGLGANFEFA